jgi:long-chain acyl-CoA synthetase
MINTSGFKVYPAEVENLLYAHPAVAEVAVFGGSDPVKGEIVKAHVVLREGQKPTQQELIEFCRGRIAKFKVPSEIQFVVSIPKNSTGKVLKRTLRGEKSLLPE